MSSPYSQKPAILSHPKPVLPNLHRHIQSSETILILSSYICLCLFPRSFPNNIFGELYKLWSSPLCIFLKPPATYSLLDPNIFLVAFSRF
jgi:hypothetical protein